MNSNIPVAILAGGKGRRMRGFDQAQSLCKPLAPIGGRPILWHVMRTFAARGFPTQIVAVGNRGAEVAGFVQGCADEPFSAQAVDTGEDAGTGGRLLRLAERLSGGTFFMAWCDGLTDADFGAMLDFHREQGRLATVLAVRPPERFGLLDLDGDRAVSFREKPMDSSRWINGGVFVLEPQVLDYIEDARVMWERAPLERLAREGKLAAFRHEGFWRCMDTLCEREQLDDLWEQGRAPWKVWE